MKDKRTGRFIGKPKETRVCLCGTEFTCAGSSPQKLCSVNCSTKSRLKQPSDKIGLSSAERQHRYRTLHKAKFRDTCGCGKEKLISAEKCRACEVANRTGANSKFWKGGYEWHIKLNRERQAQIKILGSFQPEEWEALKMKFGYMCLCCKKQEPEIKLTRDHIIPISKGGMNTIENIQPLCLSCNLRKYNKVINYIEQLV